MTDRARIAALIRALRAKTVENGCTEAEALTAAEKLAQLLRDYSMTLDEADLRASKFERHTETHEGLVGERLWKPADAIAKLTGAAYWKSRPGVYPVEINFFGFAHEVEVARYMLEICRWAMTSDGQRLERSCALLTSSARRRKVMAFLDGMADRLRQRINDMVPSAPRGTGLVVLRGQLIAKEMALAGIKTEKRKARPSRSLDASYLEGVMAGGRVALNRGLGGRPSDTRRLS